MGLPFAEKLRDGDGGLLQRCRHTLDMSVSDAARMFGIWRRSYQRWETGPHAVPGPVWVTMYLLLSARGEIDLADSLPLSEESRVLLFLTTEHASS